VFLVEPFEALARVSQTQIFDLSRHADQYVSRSSALVSVNPGNRYETRWR
jgi:hypothetical protein